MSYLISIVPDRLAHYRVAVFDGLARGLESEVVVYADLANDSSRIKKPLLNELGKYGFKYRKSTDVRFNGRLLLATGALKAVFGSSDVLIIWGDASCPGNWIAACLAKVVRKKLVFWTHGLYGNEGRLKHWFRCLFYSLADSLLLYGHHSRSQLLESGFSADKLYVINNSLDFVAQDERYFKYRTKFKTNEPDKLKLVFVGRLTPVKKLHMVLCAAKKLTSKFDVSMDFVGDGAELLRLKKLVEDFGLSQRVCFHGAVYDEDALAEHIMRADIMVSPGNVGLTAMHALVYGTPVISHSNPLNQMPEYEAIKPRVSGELFLEDDVNSLTESILRCKQDLVDLRITEESCRAVISDYYSPSYQLRVFKECLRKGVGLNEFF